MQPHSQFCVYTIKDGKELSRLAKEGVEYPFKEQKKWKTTHNLWHQAHVAKQGMPVLFGDAADCSRVLYWGFLTDVEVRDDFTTFSVDRLRRLAGEHAPQELVLRSSGKRIAPNFIRPYAICRTPDFLDSD
jgi:hypothetical protein